MKISKVEMIPVDIPLRMAFRTSVGSGTGSSFVILRISTDEGVQGIGSSNSFGSAALSREVAMAMMKNIATQALLGQDPLDTDKILNRVEALIGEGLIGDNSRILAHFDYALHDLKGKLLNVPVYQLLGGLCRDKVPLEWIVMMDEPKAQAEIALKYVKAGFHSLKLHIGADPKMAVKRFATVREAVGPSIPIGIDMAGVWRAYEALRLIEELTQYNINFAEDPTTPNDIDGLVGIKSRTKVPIVADRSARSPAEAYNVIKHNGADIFHCLLDKLGGLRNASRFATLVETADLDYAVCVMGAGISHAAGAHFAISRAKREGVNDEVGLLLYIHGQTETKAIVGDVTKEISGKIENGYLYPPNGPGLGVELDEDIVKKYAAQGVSKLVVT